MPRPKRNAIRLLLTLSSVLEFSCAGPPPQRDPVECCVIDFPRMQCICGMTGSTDAPIRKPLEYCDHAIAYPPLDWEARQNYQAEMEAFIRTSCTK